MHVGREMLRLRQADELQEIEVIRRFVFDALGTTVGQRMREIPRQEPLLVSDPNRHVRVARCSIAPGIGVEMDNSIEMKRSDSRWVGEEAVEVGMSLQQRSHLFRRVEV